MAGHDTDRLAGLPGGSVDGRPKPGDPQRCGSATGHADEMLLNSNQVRCSTSRQVLLRLEFATNSRVRGVIFCRWLLRLTSRYNGSASSSVAVSAPKRSSWSIRSHVAKGTAAEIAGRERLQARNCFGAAEKADIWCTAVEYSPACLQQCPRQRLLTEHRGHQPCPKLAQDNVSNPLEVLPT